VRHLLTSILLVQLFTHVVAPRDQPLLPVCGEQGRTTVLLVVAVTVRLPCDDCVANADECQREGQARNNHIESC